VILSLLLPKLKNLGRNGQVVAIGIKLATAGPCAPGLLPKVPTVRISQERLDQTAREGDHILIVGLVPIKSSLTRSLHETIGATGHILLLQNHLISLLVLHNVLLKHRLLRGQFGLQFGILLLRGFIKRRATAGKVQVDALDQPNLLRVETGIVTLLVDGVDLVEQTGEEHCGRVMLAQDGAHFGLHLLQLVGVLAGAEICKFT